jgi:hypothetical protein
MDRFFRNEATGEVLVFPDLLRLALQSEVADGGEHILVYDARLEADPKLLDQSQKARPIVLANPYFVLRKPSTVHVKDFQYLPMGPLAGRVVLTVSASEVGKVKSQIATDPKFFDPEYSGTSETFMCSVEVAKAELSAFEIEHVRSRSGLVRQIEALLHAVRQDVDAADREHAIELTEIIFSQGQVTKANLGWSWVVDPGPKVTRLKEVKETVRHVGGDSDYIRVG